MDDSAWAALHNALEELREISRRDALALLSTREYQEAIRRRVVLLETVNKLLQLWYDDLERPSLRVCVYRAGTAWRFSQWRGGSRVGEGDLDIPDATSEEDAIEAAWRLVRPGRGATVVKIPDTLARKRAGPRPARAAKPDEDIA